VRCLTLFGLIAAVALGCKKSDPITGPGCSITGVSISTASVAMTVGESVDVQAAVAQSGCTALPAVRFSSADPSIVTVTDGGRITAVGVGATTVTARLDGRSEQATAQVTVRGRVHSAAVTPATSSVSVAGTVQLAAVLTVDPGTPTTVRWSSSDPGKATVAESGLVTGVAAGVVTITATPTADSTRTATASVTVVPRVSGINVTPAADTIYVTETAPLTATVSGDPGVGTTVTWRTAQPAIAAVSAAGVVTGVAAGTAQITAVSSADTTFKASAAIVVLPRVTAVAVTPTPSTVPVAAVVQLTAAVTGDAGVSQAVTWASSDVSKATVNASGLVTGVSTGQATISATAVADPTKGGVAVVNVVPRVTGVSVAPATSSILVAGTATLTATVAGDPGIATTVTWSTSSPAIATVSAAGVVTGVATGTATITATSTQDPTKLGTATVVVGASPPPPPAPKSTLCLVITNVGGPAPPSPAPGSGAASTQSAFPTTCQTNVTLDLQAGDLVDLAGLVAQAFIGGIAWTLSPQSSVSMSVNATSALASLTALANGTAILDAVAPGSTPVRVTIRVRPTPSAICASLTPNGPCIPGAVMTLRVGESRTVYWMGDGQAVSAQFFDPDGIVGWDTFIGTSVTIVGLQANAEAAGEATYTGGGLVLGYGLTIHVIP